MPHPCAGVKGPTRPLGTVQPATPAGASAGPLVTPPLAGASPETVAPPTKPKLDKPKSDKPNGTFDLGGVRFTLGGFIELAGYFRSNNENRSIASSFNTIPFLGPTPQGDIGEFGLTAQQSRFSGKAEGFVDEGTRRTCEELSRSRAPTSSAARHSTERGAQPPKSA